MPISIDEFEKGVGFWRRQGWPIDFHNCFYRSHVPAIQPTDGVFDDEWWGRFYPVLQDWSATRRGGGRSAMTVRAQLEFEALTACWQEMQPHLRGDVTTVSWEVVREFTQHVAVIKGVSSPVFTAKFCHFLRPCVFPVVDNLAMGNPFKTYERHFRAVQSLWSETEPEIGIEMKRRLTALIGPEVHERFPWECKLVEIALIGRHTG